MDADSYLLKLIEKNPHLAGEAKLQVAAPKIREMVRQAFELGRAQGKEEAEAKRTSSLFDRFFGNRRF